MNIIQPRPHGHSLFDAPITVVMNSDKGQIAFTNVTEVYASHRNGTLTFISKGKTLGSVIVALAENARRCGNPEARRFVENFVVLGTKSLKEMEDHDMWNLIGYAISGDTDWAFA